MELDLAQEAVNAALSSDWKNAIKLNHQILKVNSKDTDALNRLARAYAESGDMEKAKETTQKVLKIDPINKIANRCLLKWKNFKATNSFKFSKTAFIEDPTRTRIVSLINLGDTSTLSSLNCGDIVKLIPRTHRVNVATLADLYIGRFPDDLALKFIHLIKLGGDYEVVVKNVSNSEVKIFVKALTKNGF